MFELPWWQERYGAPEAVWSGRPNSRLVEHAGPLAPGSALDVGCGEGADAVWLAERGWTVTAVDFSQAGIDRARAHAESVGAEVAACITWLREDIRVWAPPRASFDLVTSQFMQQPTIVRRPLFARLAEAVRPGGTLLVVGHHPLDIDTGLRTPANVEAMQDAMYTADQVAADLDPQIWHVQVAEAAGRDVPGPEGDPIRAHDAVLRARRSA